MNWWDISKMNLPTKLKIGENVTTKTPPPPRRLHMIHLPHLRCIRGLAHGHPVAPVVKMLHLP